MIFHGVKHVCFLLGALTGRMKIYLPDSTSNFGVKRRQGEQTHIHVALWWLTQNSTSLGPSWGLAVQGDPGFWLPFHLGYDWVDLGWRLRVRVPLSLGAQRKLKAISRLEAKWTSPLPLLGRRDSSPADPKKAAPSAAMDSWMPSGHLHSPHWADPDHPLESYVPGMFELWTRYILYAILAHILGKPWVKKENFTTHGIICRFPIHRGTNSHHPFQSALSLNHPAGNPHDLGNLHICTAPMVPGTGDPLCLFDHLGLHLRQEAMVGLLALAGSLSKGRRRAVREGEENGILMHRSRCEELIDDIRWENEWNGHGMTWM